MRAHRVLSCALIVAFLCLPAATHVIAADANKPKAKTRKKVERAPIVLSPTGAKSAPTRSSTRLTAAPGSSRNTPTSWGRRSTGSERLTSTSRRRFARWRRPPLPSGRQEQASPCERSEAPTPAWRILRSDVPDPVVQAAVQPTDALEVRRRRSGRAHHGLQFRWHRLRRHPSAGLQRLGRGRPVRRDRQQPISSVVAQPHHDGGDVHSGSCEPQHALGGFRPMPKCGQYPLLRSGRDLRQDGEALGNPDVNRLDT